MSDTMELEQPQSTPTPQQQGGNDQGSSRRQGLLAVNDLNYLLEPDLSVAVAVTHKNHYFQTDRYTNGQRGICILNSGADYVDTRRSYLRFNLEGLDDDLWGHFGKNGSVLNLIRQVTITTRSGDEISRCTGFNLLKNMTLGYEYDSEWLDALGQPFGYNDKQQPGNYTAGDTISNGDTFLTVSRPSKTYCIPLFLLSEFFAYGRLLPSMLMSGLRIEIEFEDPKIAFIARHNVNNLHGDIPNYAITKYVINNPYISLKSVQLTDATQRALNEQSAVNGLEIVYCDWEQTQTSWPQSQSRVHIEVRKACSRALKALARSRLNINATGHRDSLAAEVFDFTQYQWQLGSLYFPQQPIRSITGTPLEIAAETYMHTLDSFNKGLGGKIPSTKLARQAPASSTLGGDTSNFVTHQATAREWNLGLEVDPVSSKWVIADLHQDKCVYPTNELSEGSLSGLHMAMYGQHGSFLNKGATLGVTLERSTMFNLAGVPINNSRVLALHAEFESNRDRVIDVFLKYVKLARVFLNNVEVEQ